MAGVELEACVDGAWWDVEQLRIEGGKMIAHFENQTRDYDEGISVEQIRLRSRAAIDSDCIDFLKPNTDVCVFAAHPKARLRTSGFNPFRAWYDAKIISSDKKPHRDGCDCKFYVKFYRANREDVLDLEHRPLFGSRKRKVGIESIAILQAPCQLEGKPSIINKPVETCIEDSSTIRVPAVASRSMKLHIEELISFSVKQGVVLEISLKLLEESDLNDPHEDDALGLRDSGDQVNLFHSKFQLGKDGDCVMIKQQGSMPIISSNKDMGCFILCIDKYHACQVNLQFDDQKAPEKFSGKPDCNDGCDNSWIQNGLSKISQESQNENTISRQSECLTKQSEQFSPRRKCKPVSNHLNGNTCFPGKLENHRDQVSKVNITTRCPSTPARKKRKIIASSRRSRYLQAQAQEIEYRQGKQKLTLLGQGILKRMREPRYDVCIIRRSKRLREQAQKIQNKLLQIQKEKVLMKYEMQKASCQKRKNKEVVGSNPPFSNVEFSNINSNINVNACFDLEAVGIPTEKWIENIPANILGIDMYTETCDTTNSGICMTLDLVELSRDEYKTRDIENSEPVVPEMETLAITMTPDIAISQEEIIDRRSLIPIEVGDGFSMEMSSEGTESEFPMVIADFKQSRMPISDDMIPANSLELENSERDNKCIHNLDNGGSHEVEVSKKSIPLDMQNNETAFHKYLLNRSDKCMYMEEKTEQFEIEDANGTAPKLEDYNPIQISDPESPIFAAMGDDSKFNQKCNTICIEEASTENHMEKVSAMASHVDISLMVDRDTTSLISVNSEEPNKENKCRRSLKEKPKIKQEARNKQGLRSAGQNEIANEGGLEEGGFGTKSFSKLIDRSSRADQPTPFHSEIHTLGNPEYLQEVTKAGNASNIALQIGGNESMETDNIGTQYVVVSDSRDSEEVNANSWIEEVTPSVPHASASKGTVQKTSPVISIISDNANRMFEHQNYFKDRKKQLGAHQNYCKDRKKQLGAVLHGKRTVFLSKEENDLRSSAERVNNHYVNMSTVNVALKRKDLSEDIKMKFQRLSASIESEIHKPSPPVLVRWSMIEKKNEVHEGFISDLIINEDGFDFNSTIEEKSSDLKNLWEEMERTLNGDLCDSENMHPTDRASAGNSAEAEAEDDAYSHFCISEHEFILDEEIGIICRICNFVKTEINNVSAPFQLWNSETIRSRSRDNFYMDRNFGDIVIPTLDDDSPCSQSSKISEKHDSVWEIIPELEEKMNAHQKRAFEFLWRNLAGSLVPEEIEASENDIGGCIIAHAPGTGKSFTIISFLQSYMTLFPRCKPLIIAPKSMLYTWAREFQKWNVNIPVYILNSLRDFKRKENPLRISAMLKSCKASLRQIYNVHCIAMLHEWHKKESVLVLSYPLFYTLTNEENANSEERMLIGKYLSRSPGLLILDEGHIPRSHRSKIWNLLMKINTRLRILLSGTLFQNNFEEYFNTLCLARPAFVDRILRWRRHRSKGIEEEQKEKIARRYFVEEIAKKINIRSMERGTCRQLLKSMTEDFIDVYKGDVLGTLPGLRTYMVMLRPTHLQETLLTKIDETINVNNGSSLELEFLVSIVSIHPSLFNDLLFTSKYFSTDYRSLERFRKYPDQGVKLKFVVQIMELCSCKGEKVLIFCQYIPPLLLLEEIFQSHFHWSKGEEILLLEGKHSLDERQDVIDKFSQQGGKARVLLASIKACGVGVNLTEASRVILLDPVWNPSCSKQAICRAFRMGQKRFVHVYQLIAFGTLEEEKYEKSVWKERMSNLIYSSDGRQNVEALNIEDDVLRQLVEEDGTMFQRIMEQEDIQKHKDSSDDMEIDIDDILPLD
ncbi:SNF2 domain-containing protein CLASSY 2 [Cryptomeria japonica]|uniref:SNF2 domain-containing protein CLASSY 2 n=1 Tax=Cryptomeria japonica TaxID=3369 RepID=UPI0027DA40B6|nr:SNF2 domain-containing protein CLASSY 2 [Cryptomeria japonica]